MLTPQAAVHVANRRNRGPLDRFTHYGESGTPGEGAFVSLWFQVEDSVIKRAAWDTHGCMWSMACASCTAEILINRPVEKALLLEARDLDLILGGIPEGKGQFAEMCANAVSAAFGHGNGKRQSEI